MRKNDGGTAFPCTLRDQVDGGTDLLPGMTLRDYFAAKAMQSFIPLVNEKSSAKNAQDAAKVTAQFAYMTADAMLAERSKQEAEK